MGTYPLDPFCIAVNKEGASHEREAKGLPLGMRSLGGLLTPFISFIQRHLRINRKRV